MTFPDTGINVTLTCLQTVCIYPVDRQAVICTYCWYHATDFDTLRMSCLILFIITALDFHVYILQKTCGLCISIVPSNESHLQLWVKWQTYWRDFQILCAYAMPKFWVKLIYVTLLRPLYLEWLQWFLENLWTPAIVCTCISSIQKGLWKQHAVFYGVCWLIAVLKIFETFMFP